MRRVFALGESLLDIVFTDEIPVVSRPGGSLLNFAVSLGRVGLPVFLISEYGEDRVGDLIDSFLLENNVQTKYCRRFKDGKSALALAFLNENKDALYDFYKTYPETRLTQEIPVFTEADILVFGSFYSVAPEVRNRVRQILEHAKSAGTLIIYDPNFRKNHKDKLPAMMPFILENLKIADLIKGSDEDFQNIFGTLDLEKLYTYLGGDDRILILTGGDKGAICYGNQIFHRMDAEKIIPVSTMGAGDNFNAGMVFELIHRGIFKQNLPDKIREEGNHILRQGIIFATQTCLSMDNYISQEFANMYSKKN